MGDVAAQDLLYLQCPAVLTMARIAALSEAGSFFQAVTILARSGQDGIEFRESIRESPSEFPIKSGGERGIRTPDTAFGRIPV